MKNSRSIMKKCDDNGRLIWFVNKIDIIVPKPRDKNTYSTQENLAVTYSDLEKDALTLL